MKALDIELSGGSASEAELLKFEEFIHARLPSSYRSFLQLNNGGIPSGTSDTFISKVDLIVGNQITVEQFYSLRDDASPLLSLYKAVRDYIHTVPINTVPIAHDSFGNVIGLEWDTEQVNWTLCQGGYPFDFHRNFNLGVNFAQFVDALGEGLYGGNGQLSGQQKNRGFWQRLFGKK